MNKIEQLAADRVIPEKVSPDLFYFLMRDSSAKQRIKDYAEGVRKCFALCIEELEKQGLESSAVCLEHYRQWLESEETDEQG